MNGYVVTLIDDERSMLAAERCIESVAEFDITLAILWATAAKDADDALADLNLKRAKFEEKYSNPAAQLANFCSQYRAWTLATLDDSPTLICEHDAKFIAPLPKDFHCELVVNIGKPSFGKFREKKEPGIYPLFSKAGGHFGGAHAYVVSRAGAKMLIGGAQEYGAMPVDMFLSRKRFNGIEELWPWPAVADDRFSSIQVERGCRAKHSFSPGYEHL